MIPDRLQNLQLVPRRAFPRMDFLGMPLFGCFFSRKACFLHESV